MNDKDFGFAIKALKEGKKVTRSGWNGKGMYLTLSFVAMEEDQNKEQLPVQQAIFMKTAQNNFVAWLASQSDVLAEDWEVLE